MSRIRSKMIKPELLSREKSKGFAYQPKVYGNPDFISCNKKKVIFIDGCFWHKCPIHFIMPKSNKSYRLLKINKNILRDKEITLAYQNSGWIVERIWEHSLK